MIYVKSLWCCSILIYIYKICERIFCCGAVVGACMTIFIAFLGREFDSTTIMCLLIYLAAPGELTSCHLGSPAVTWHRLCWVNLPGLTWRGDVFVMTKLIFWRQNRRHSRVWKFFNFDNDAERVSTMVSTKYLGYISRNVWCRCQPEYICAADSKMLLMLEIITNSLLHR